MTPYHRQNATVEVRAKRYGISVEEMQGHIDRDEKRCGKCGRWLVGTEANFYRDRERQDGWFAYCKLCTAKAVKEKRAAKRSRAKRSSR